jgi:hypothetical protein
MSDNGKGFYQAASYLGQHFNISKGILKETACMAIEERTLIADIESILTVMPHIENIENLSLEDILKKIVLPIVKNEGLAKWQRDVVTDMAMKKGDTTKKDSWKHGKQTDKDSEIDNDAE